VSEDQVHLGAKGCLTAAGLAALSAAPPGDAPEDLARHVAACRSCQRRWFEKSLTAEERARRTKAPKADAKARFWRMVLFALLVLVLALGTLVTLRFVVG
jgi:hypothetical protein